MVHIDTYKIQMLKNWQAGYVSKSIMVNEFTFCEKACAFTVNGISPKTPELNTLNLQYGTNFHNMVEYFHVNVDIEQILRCRDQIHCLDYFMVLLEKWCDPIHHYEVRFAEFQIARLHQLQKGKWNHYISGWERLFKPYFNELQFKVEDVKIGTHSLNLVGTIDQVDCLPKKQYGIVEYKTNQSAKLSKVRKECIFYSYGANKLREIGEIGILNDVEYIGGYNPICPEGTFGEKISKRSRNSFIKLVDKFVKWDADPETSNQNFFMCTWCKYYDLCWD